MGEGAGALGSGCCPARWRGAGAPRGSWGQRIPRGGRSQLPATAWAGQGQGRAEEGHSGL